MLTASDPVPVAAGVVEFQEPPSDGPSVWVLELGEAARRAKFRSELQSERGHHVRAWSSRREAARARRRFVQDLLTAREPDAVESPGVEQLTLDLEPVVDPLPLVVDELPEVASEIPPSEPEIDEPAEEEETFGPALLDRISAYTLSSR